MEELADNWIKVTRERIEKFMESSGAYELLIGARIINVPVVNIFMLPTNYTDRRFTLTHFKGEDGSNVKLVPSEAQTLSQSIFNKLSTAYPLFTFGLANGENTSIYITCSCKEE